MNPFRVDADGNVLGDIVGATIAPDGTVVLERLKIPDDVLDLATVGALLVNEGISDSRALVQHPMTVTFLSGGPKVVPYKLEDGEGLKVGTK